MRKCVGSDVVWYTMGIGEPCGLFVFLWDRSVIRRACGDSYVKHDVYIDEQKGGAQKGRRGCGGVREG